jgi:demethylmenaquinone methyltransferase/2-methoxy-6-polyprenyl-1,4-benzoquinol methylase
VFDGIAPHYEFVNHVLTLGLDRWWRRRAAQVAARDGGTHWLDVCTGTGELARLLRRLAPPEALVMGLDFSLPMLQLARRSAGPEAIPYLQGEAAALPFPDASLDLITVSFATRNLASSRQGLEACLGEFARVLRPGGRFVNMETSQPPARLIRWLFHLYVRLLVEALGSRLSRSRRGYGYLAASMLRWPEAPALSRAMLDAGFSRAAHRPLLFGATAIHVATR